MNLKKEFEYWLKEAEFTESVVAYYHLAWCYELGLGTPINLQQSKVWYEKIEQTGGLPTLFSLAVKAKDKKAQFVMGRMYEYGQCEVESDLKMAFYFYSLSAVQNYAPAQNNLGILYLLGKGVYLNYGEAVKWLQRAADQGDSMAQYNLGYMYAHGLGVEEDEIKAQGWVRKAALQGNSYAINSLSYTYNSNPQNNLTQRRADFINCHLDPDNARHEIEENHLKDSSMNSWAVVKKEKSLTASSFKVEEEIDSTNFVRKPNANVVRWGIFNLTQAKADMKEILASSMAK